MPSAIEAFEKLHKQNPMLAKGLIYQAAAEKSLYEFIKLMWEYIEPGVKFKNARHIQVICDHLEAVSRGEIRKLLINIPPGFSKSLTCNVFWPAWEWIHWPHLRYLTFSYAANLTERDNARFVAVIRSDIYQALWGSRFSLIRDNQTKTENNKTGWKIASSVNSGGTGERGNRVVTDDANNIKDVESKITRDEINRWYTEVLPSRVIDPDESVFINIQQRSNEDDVSGLILSREMGYEHLCYDENTEILTESGWKLFSSLSDEMVMGVDPNTLNAKWEKPTSYIKYHYEGEMLHFESTAVDLLVTPDHRMIYLEPNEYYRGVRKNKIRQARDLPGDFILPQVINWKQKKKKIFFGGIEWSSDNFAEFMGWYFSEGCASEERCTTRIVQQIGGNFDSIKLLLDRCGLRYSIYAHGKPHVKCFTIFSKPLASALEKYGDSHGKYLPRILKDLPSNSLEKFILAYAAGDGCKSGRYGNGILLSSRSKKLIDDVQECCVKAGWATSSRERPCPYRFFNGYNIGGGFQYFLYIRNDKRKGKEKKRYAKVIARHRKSVLYSGNVYCVSVPSTAIVVRRNGKISISGNCLPMEFDSTRKCHTSIGWEDWREYDGDLLWPEVYNQRVVDDLKSDKTMTSYAYAGQYQQMPAPRGGGIIKSSWWKLYPKEGEAFDEFGSPINPVQYPIMDYIIGSVDTAYTEKKTNDYSAMVVLGLYREEGQPRVLLMDAWQKRMTFHGTVPTKRKGESRKDYIDRDEWGLVELVAYTAHMMQVDKILIENTAAGIPLMHEIRRLYGNEKFGVQAIVPKGDKIARAHAVAHLFENGIISAPERWWAQVCIDQTSIFPRGAHDDLPDCLFMGLKHLRDTGWAMRTDEYEEEVEPKEYTRPQGALYDV